MFLVKICRLLLETKTLHCVKLNVAIETIQISVMGKMLQHAIDDKLQSMYHHYHRRYNDRSHQIAVKQRDTPCWFMMIALIEESAVCIT